MKECLIKKLQIYLLLHQQIIIPRYEEAYTFFKIVQNKLHFAISGHTTAQLIYIRANSNKDNIGLTSFKNSPDCLIYKYDVVVAKNYLNEEELNKLNDLTNMFLVFAEDEAKERHIITMKDWINATKYHINKQ